MRPKYKDKRTERFAMGERVKEFQPFERQAYKRLEILEAAPNKQALILLPSNRFEAFGVIVKVNTASALISDGEFVLYGLKESPTPFTLKL